MYFLLYIRVQAAVATYNVSIYKLYTHNNRTPDSVKIITQQLVITRSLICFRTSRYFRIPIFYSIVFNIFLSSFLPPSSSSSLNLSLSLSLSCYFPRYIYITSVNKACNLFEICRVLENIFKAYFDLLFTFLTWLTLLTSCYTPVSIA